MALLAATTLGASYSGHVRAEVKADGGPTVARAVESPGAYRLVVQSYAPGALTAADLPSEHARPLAAMQRAVTADELHRGVAVDIVEVADAAVARVDDPVLVAWVEPGQPDLEYGAMRARPSPGAVFGVEQLRRDGQADLPAAQVVLRRRTQA
jgi:hypothetical protein